MICVWYIYIIQHDARYEFWVCLENTWKHPKIDMWKPNFATEIAIDWRVYFIFRHTYIVRLYIVYAIKNIIDIIYIYVCVYPDICSWMILNCKTYKPAVFRHLGFIPRKTVVHSWVCACSYDAANWIDADRHQSLYPGQTANRLQYILLQYWVLTSVYISEYPHLHPIQNNTKKRVFPSFVFEHTLFKIKNGCDWWVDGWPMYINWKYHVYSTNLHDEINDFVTWPYATTALTSWEAPPVPQISVAAAACCSLGSRIARFRQSGSKDRNLDVGHGVN